MPDDAMELWRREIEEQRGTPRRAAPASGSSSPASRPPPGSTARPRRSTRSVSGSSALRRLDAQLAMPVILGATVALAVLFVHGWPPPLAPVSPAFMLVPGIAAGAGVAARRSRRDLVGWALSAAISGAATVCIVVPVWGLFELLDCWLSWFADC